MKSPIRVEFTAISRHNSSSYNEHFSVTSEQELIEAIKAFDKNVTYRKYDMETYAEHENGSKLTKKERAWFIDQDKKEYIGFC